MTISDIESIESRFNVRLPAEYREFLQAYPDILVTTKTDYRWKQESPAERELHNDAAVLIELNEHVRKPGVSWLRGGGAWPPNHFVIGDDECGDFWSVDADSDESAVYFYDHELGRFERQHDSIAAFAANLLNEIAEWNR